MKLGRALAITALLGAGACAPRALDDWLRCGDCLEGERQRAADVGLRALPFLGSALRGLSAEERANLTRQFRQSYRTILRYSGTGPAPAVSEAVYVSESLANADATHRKRAATALADISARSRSAAVAAQPYLAAVLLAHTLGTDRLREDVLRAVEAAMAAASYAPFDGTLSDSAVAFLDTVTVIRAAGAPPWDTALVRVTLPGSPFPEALPTGRWTDSLRFVAVGPPGQYAVVLSGVGAGGRDERAPLTITAMPYAPVDSAGAPIVAMNAAGLQRFLVVREGAAADHVRWILTDTASVAFRLEWREFEPVGPPSLGDIPFARIQVLSCGSETPVPDDPAVATDFPAGMVPAPGIASAQRRWNDLPPGCWLARVQGVNLNAIARLLGRVVS